MKRNGAIAALCFALGALAGSPVAAQLAEPEPSPEAAPAAESAAVEAQPPAASVPADSGVRAELEALRSEVQELRTRVDDAEVAALAAEAENSASTPAMLRLYGFMDFGFDKFFFGDDDDTLGILRPTEAGTFVFGNLNVYFDARPVENLHAMVELRFTVAPHGEEVQLGPPLGTSYERIDSLAFDFSSPSLQSQLRLGSIYIERAYTEYTFSSLFKLQWGMFLTPFGIWNLDHGSPTLISLMLPTFIAGQMVPTRLLGVHLYGSALLGSFELGYALHVSNGRSPLDFDLSEDKAGGVRVFLAKEVERTRWALGSSLYLGRYVDMVKRVNGPASSDFVEWSDSVDYDEQVLGFDAALDLGDFRARSEAVFRWVHYRDGKSEAIFLDDGSQGFLPNRLEWDVYGLIAYRTPWLLEPYVQFEMMNKSYLLPRFAGTSRATETGWQTMAISVGLNLELTSHTLLKTQVAWLDATNDASSRNQIDMPIVFARVVSSF